MEFVKRHFIVLLTALTVLGVGLVAAGVNLTPAEFHSPIGGTEVVKGVFDNGVGGDGLGHAFVKGGDKSALAAWQATFPNKVVVRESPLAAKWSPNSAANYAAEGSYVLYRIVK